MNASNKSFPMFCKKAVLSGFVLTSLCLGLSGCISSSNPSPPERTTIVVPSGTTVYCADGTAPPCR